MEWQETYTQKKEGEEMIYLIAAGAAIVGVAVLVALRATRKAWAKPKYTMVPAGKRKPKPGTMATVIARSRFSYETPGVPNRASIRQRLKRTGRFRTLRFRSRKYRRLMARGEVLVFKAVAPRYGRRSERPLTDAS